MKKIAQCASCHDQWRVLKNDPFCSTICEKVFHEYASIETINKVYEEFKSAEDEEEYVFNEEAYDN